MIRTIHEDERGYRISVGGWVLRPAINTTRAQIGMKVTVTGGTDPTRRKFGVLHFDRGYTEQWAIRNSENIADRSVAER